MIMNGNKKHIMRKPETQNGDEVAEWVLVRKKQIVWQYR